MVRRLIVVLAVNVVVCSLAAAKEVLLPVTGSVGVFRSDLRIFNPYQSRDIQIHAYLLPAGNVNNAGVQPVTITVARRQMAVYNDVVSSLFHSGGLGGIRLTSSDEFIATQRVYATSTAACNGAINPCTLGQFLVGVDAGDGRTNGVLIQLSSPSGSVPAYRTNIGALNTTSFTATVIWRVYDRSGLLVGSPKTIQMPAYAVLSPSDIRTFGSFVPPGADLTEAWVSFTSDQPIVAYASVIDNGSTDQTYIPAAMDIDPPASNTTPALDLNGTFVGQSRLTGMSGVMSMTLTQTGNSISGYGQVVFDQYGNDINILIDGTVSGSSLTLNWTGNGGGCPTYFTNSITTATNDVIAGTYTKSGWCDDITASGTFSASRQ